MKLIVDHQLANSAFAVWTEYNHSKQVTIVYCDVKLWMNLIDLYWKNRLSIEIRQDYNLEFLPDIFYHLNLKLSNEMNYILSSEKALNLKWPFFNSSADLFLFTAFTISRNSLKVGFQVWINKKLSFVG